MSPRSPFDKPEMTSSPCVACGEVIRHFVGIERPTCEDCCPPKYDGTEVDRGKRWTRGGRWVNAPRKGAS